MQVTKLLICIFISIATARFTLLTEPTGFNYTKHGTDWPITCTNKSRIIIDYQVENQSPINLAMSTSNSQSSYLFTDFRPINAIATIYNTTILIKPASENDRFGQLYSETINQTHYSFQATQIRVRVGSQHRVQQDDKTFRQYSLELQIHTFPLLGKQNDKIVLGLLFDVNNQSNSDDPFLRQLVEAGQNKTYNQSFNFEVDLSHLLSREQVFNFWFYLGSLTYPPCRDKGMNWVIPHKVFKMSQNQLDFFNKLYPNGNWRVPMNSSKNQIGFANVLPFIEDDL